MRRPSNLTVGLGLFAALVGLASCFTWKDRGSDQDASSDSGTASSVVERSRRQPPAWVALPAAQLTVDEGRLRYAVRRLGQRDLPLGLKEAQSQALRESRTALLPWMQRRLEEHGGRPTAALTPHLEAAISETQDRGARVEDIYFEVLGEQGQTQGRAQETYVVWVLVSFPQEQVMALFSDLGRRLRSLPDQELRRLGEVAAQLAQVKNISH